MRGQLPLYKVTQFIAHRTGQLHIHGLNMLDMKSIVYVCVYVCESEEVGG